MARIEEISLGDVVETARRYRPVAAVAGVILLAALVLPAAPRPGGEALDPFTARPATGAGEASVTTTTAPESPAAPPTTAFDDDFTFAPTTPAEPDDDSFSGGGFVAPPSSGFSGGSSPTTQPQERPLRTTVTGWASATGGTPLGATGVPPQSLPVGNRVGQLDKASFIRLAGTATELFLKEDPEGSRTTSGEVAVKACQITASRWEGADNQSFDQAPDWDAVNCIAGARSQDGVWRFDLSTFADPTDDRGFALVPGNGASIDFQVAFEQQAVGG